MKSLSYDVLMALDEAEIKAIFPNGGQEKNGKWKPAEGEVDRTLVQLLRDKRKRFEQDRFLNSRYSRSNYTDVAALGLKGEGAAVPKTVQEDFSREARERFMAGRPERSLADRVAALEGKVRRDQLASLRKRVEALERATGERAA